MKQKITTGKEKKCPLENKKKMSDIKEKMPTGKQKQVR